MGYTINRAWQRIDTYGGKLTENVVQATARDLLLDAMFKVDDKGIKIIGTEHDEIIADVPADKAEATLELLHNCMTDAPTWAKGLPVAAEGFIAESTGNDNTQ